MDFEKQLGIYLRARFTLIVLVTPEEERAVQAIQATCNKMNCPSLTWDAADGFQPLAGGRSVGAVCFQSRVGRLVRDSAAGCPRRRESDGKSRKDLFEDRICRGDA